MAQQNAAVVALRARLELAFTASRNGLDAAHEVTSGQRPGVAIVAALRLAADELPGLRHLAQHAQPVISRVMHHLGLADEWVPVQEHDRR